MLFLWEITFRYQDPILARAADARLESYDGDYNDKEWWDIAEDKKKSYVTESVYVISSDVEQLRNPDAVAKAALRELFESEEDAKEKYVVVERIERRPGVIRYTDDVLSLFAILADRNDVVAAKRQNRCHQ